MTYSLFAESFFSISISFKIELNCSDSVASVFKGVNSFKAFLKRKIHFYTNKVREMQNSSMVFKSNLDYYQRIAHKKFSEKNVLLDLDFPTSIFPAGAPS